MKVLRLLTRLTTVPYLFCSRSPRISPSFVKRWRSTATALRWTAAAMLEAKNGLHTLKAYRFAIFNKVRDIRRGWHAV
jgi:hypothetical protein